MYKIYFQADIIKESMITPVRRDAGNTKVYKQ